MTFRLGQISGNLAQSGIRFNAFQRYSEDEEWTQTSINETKPRARSRSAPLNRIV